MPRHSLVGQLRYIREHWAWLLGSDLEDLFDRIDRAIGILVEEEMGLHRRFGGGGGGDGGHGDRPVDGDRRSPASVDEPEAFSSDSAWMPRLVLLAKSTYVWLDQLSRRYQRDIHTLDAIPDDELDRLADWGITGLWLIGLWERSKASERIKRMRGNSEAVASAYSLDDYRIADDLGGEAAYADLRDRAGQRGIRLASDMVPNHMGIDSSWVTQHPEWFLRLPEPPYPGYTFNGPDLSSDERVGIVLEDHYWDDSDAAVVFKRFDRATGDVQYIYHGNDGTSFPWNDTAQLDFVDAAVREQVIQTILAVARRFPVIRFDAAMVLAKRHVQRLWWPLPGRRRRDPVARRVRALPGRVRPAHADRVLARGRRPGRGGGPRHAPAGRGVLDARGLLRPDARHAPRLQQRVHAHAPRRGRRRATARSSRRPSSSTRRSSSATSTSCRTRTRRRRSSSSARATSTSGSRSMMATLPGLPMLGHGQVEGFGEKYGMEFRRAVLDEQADPWLLERHRRELFPLFHRRGLVRGGGRLPAVRRRDAVGRGRRGRLRLLERLGSDADARPVSRPVRRDDRHDPRIRRLRPADGERREAARPAGASPTAWPSPTIRTRS